MDFRIDSMQDGGARAFLAGALTIQHARAALPALLDSLSGGPRVEFDLSAVTALDAAGLQLLMLCKREAERLGHRLELVGHSEAVVDQFELFNLAGYFGDPLCLRPMSTAGAAP